MFIFTVRSNYLFVLAFFLSFSATVICGADDDTNVLKMLEERFSGIDTIEASVKQIKKLKVLDGELVLTGKIFLKNPDKFAWHVESPVKYSMVIDGKTLRQWDEDSDKIQKISLSGNPLFKVVSDQITSWFSGKYASLSSEYNIDVTKLAGMIILKFTPNKDTMACKVIKNVAITLDDDAEYVAEVQIVDVGGDITTLIFQDTILNKPIKPTAWEVRPSDR